PAAHFISRPRAAGPRGEGERTCPDLESEASLSRFLPHAVCTRVPGWTPVALSEGAKHDCLRSILVTAAAQALHGSGSYPRRSPRSARPDVRGESHSLDRPVRDAVSGGPVPLRQSHGEQKAVGTGSLPVPACR